MTFCINFIIKFHIYLKQFVAITNSPESIPGTILEVVISKQIRHQNIARIKEHIPLGEHIPQNLLLGGLLVGITHVRVQRLLHLNLPDKDPSLSRFTPNAEPIGISDNFSSFFLTSEIERIERKTY